MPHICKALLIVACICLSVLSSIGQTNEGGILLIVKDQFDSTIADAEIVLSRRGSQEVVRRVKTDQRGIAQISRLGGGDYRIDVSAPGFKPYNDDQLRLEDAKTRRLEITLEIAPIESKVDIGEEEAVNAESAGAVVVLREDEIAKLPENQEDLERAIRRIGEAATGEDLPVSVNGVQDAKIPPKAAIQQIRVNQNVFSAQYDSPFGGGIDIFTRSNVDKFRSYVGFTFADSRLNAADPFIARRVPYQARTYFFSLSGPLLSKKANFFAYGSRSESDSSSVINAVVLDQNLQQAEFKQTLVTPNRAENFSFTVNADPNKKHKLYLNYNLGNSRAQNQNTGGFSLPSRANNTNSQSHFLQLSETYLANPNVVSQTRFQGSYWTNKSFGGSNAPAINVLDAFFGGGSQQRTAAETLRFDMTNDTTWQMGRYTLGFGVRFRGERINQNSANNFGGTYTFSGRTAPLLDANDNPVLSTNGSIVTTQITSLESYRRTLLFRQLGFTNQRIRELGGGANQFTISGGDPEITASQYDAGFYVQNSYKISETIAASFGVRYENQTNVESNFNLAPRFGIIWAPKAKDKQKPIYQLPRVSIGYGLFYSRFGLNSTVSVRQASDPDRRQFLITETNILDLYPNVPTVDLLQQFALPRTQRFINEEFETPYQSVLNVTVSKKLPKGFTLNATFSKGKTLRQAFTQNINAPLAGTYDPRNPSLAVRPFGNVGNIYDTRSSGQLRTERFNLSLSFPQSQKLSASLRYSYWRSKSNVVSGSGSSFDPYDFSEEFTPTPLDGLHNAGGYFFWTLPHKVSLFGDFSISSGTRFNITTGRDTNGDGYYSERPSFASDLNKAGLISTQYGILDPNPSPNDRLIPRNLGRGKTTFIFNSSIQKTFGFNEDKKNKKPPKQTINFGLRVNNVFNIINKATPIGNMASPNFLKSLSSFSDGGVITINGAVQENFPGRSLSLNIGFGF